MVGKEETDCLTSQVDRDVFGFDFGRILPVEDEMSLTEDDWPDGGDLPHRSRGRH